MQITRLVKARYPDETWRAVLPVQRYKTANRILASRKKNQTDVDLMDCLTLDDKQSLVSATPELRKLLRLPDPDATETLFRRVIELRNDLAHAHHITSKWPDFLADARVLEQMIEAAEQITSRQVRSLSRDTTAP